MIISYSILLSSGSQLGIGPQNTMHLSAVKDTFTACLNITKLETSTTAWWGAILTVGWLSRYNAVVF